MAVLVFLALVVLAVVGGIVYVGFRLIAAGSKPSRRPDPADDRYAIRAWSRQFLVVAGIALIGGLAYAIYAAISGFHMNIHG